MKLILITVLLLGLVLAVRLLLFYTFPLQLQDGENISFHTTILSDPKIDSSSQQVTVRFGNFGSSTPVTLIAPKNMQLFYGESIQVTGRVTKKVLTSRSSSENVAIAIYFPKIEANISGMLPFFNKIRQELIAFCEKTFSQPYSSLFLGILFGIKTTLTGPLTISFRITGVTHVIAASGMNVTLVGGFLSGALSKILKRQWATVGTIGAVLFYAVLSGLDPSIVRAAVMACFAYGAAILGRQYTAFYGIFLTAAGMLFYDPLLLVNVGFQLSVVSTLGILFIKPLIPLRGFLFDDIGTTFAAQLATLPILLSTFGTYGLLSLLVNALVLWTIPIIMVIGGIGVGVGLVFEQIGRLIVDITFPLLWYFVGVVEYFAKWNWTLKISSLPIFLVIGYYLLLTSVVLLWNGKH